MAKRRLRSDEAIGGVPSDDEADDNKEGNKEGNGKEIDESRKLESADRAAGRVAAALSPLTSTLPPSPAPSLSILAWTGVMSVEELILSG